MATTPIATATIRELQDRWAKEIASTLPVQTLSADSSSNPVLTLSADATPATGEKVVVVRCKPVTQTANLNVLNLSAQAFSPHVIQICTELNYAGTTDNVADILTAVELLPVIAGCAKLGMVVEWYASDNGTVPSTTQMVAANLKATWMPNLYQGFGAAI